jgi:hypothetical protein
MTMPDPRTTDLPGATDAEVVRDVDDPPAGSGVAWLRERLSGQPSPRVKQWAQVMLWVGLVVLLIAELIDELKTSRRRLSHLASSWWAGIERRERRHARRSSTAALASRIQRRHPPRRA